MTRSVALPGSVAVLRVPWRPWTTNHERKLVPMQRARLVREWREGAAALALEQKLPRFVTPVSIVAEPCVARRGLTQDVGACLPAVKATVDGLVDAGVLVDDSPRFVRRITFEAVRLGEDALVLTIESFGPDSEAA